MFIITKHVVNYFRLFDIFANILEPKIIINKYKCIPEILCDYELTNSHCESYNYFDMYASNIDIILKYLRDAEELTQTKKFIVSQNNNIIKISYSFLQYPDLTDTLILQTHNYTLTEWSLALESLKQRFI